MGTYATTTSVTPFLVGARMDSNTTALLSSCITRAETEVDAALIKRYSVSDFRTTVPPAVRTITEELALAHFWFHNSKGSKESMTRSMEIRKPARALLRDLADGTAQLCDTAGALIPVGSNHPGVLSNTEDYTPTFAEDNPIKWKVDRDKLENIRDERD